MSDVLLSVNDLAVEFATRSGTVQAVRGVTFVVARNEFVGVVGESGSGKSVTARALLGLVDRPGRIAAGSVHFEDRDVLTLPTRELRALRGKLVSMVFQDPMTSLNPVFTIGRQLRQVMQAHGTPGGDDRAEQLLRDVEIPAPGKRLRQYPHELSGGMRQRVMIAMALANDPALVIADEPTTALDVTVQAQILELLRRINEEKGTSILLISHSLDVVGDVSDRVLVFYAGKIVEQGATSTVFDRPRHPYTRALMRSVPRGDRSRLVPLVGRPPSLCPPPVGCSFADRCDLREPRCSVDPPLVEVEAGHSSACWVTADDGSGHHERVGSVRA